MKKNNPPVKPYIQALVAHPPGKPIDELTREYGITRVVKLASNENPLGPSPGAVAAIQEDLRNLHRYPDGSGYYLKAALRQLGSLLRSPFCKMLQHSSPPTLREASPAE